MWKADFWYIDQLSDILHRSSIKIILTYNKNIESQNVHILNKFLSYLRIYSCHRKHSTALIFNRDTAY